MPRVLTNDEWTQLLREQDPFKLAIRGHSALEAMINAAIADAVEGRPANELLRLPFRTRMALAVGLGIVLDVHRRPIEALAKLRHDFAHGNIDQLTGQRSRAIAQVFAPHLPAESVPLLEGSPPQLLLAVTLTAARVFIQVSTRAARDIREDQRRSVRVQCALRARHGALVRQLREPGQQLPHRQ